MRHTVNVRKETLKINLTKAQYEVCRTHYKSVNNLQLLAGDAYHQGGCWYEFHLKTDKFPLDVCVTRILDCLAIALHLRDSILKAKAQHSVLQDEIQEVRNQHPVRLVVPVNVFHHGKTFQVTRLPVAIKNRHNVLAQSIAAFQKPVPASSDLLHKLVASYS